MLYLWDIEVVEQGCAWNALAQMKCCYCLRCLYPEVVARIEVDVSILHYAHPRIG